MIALLWKRAALAALRRSWAQRSRVWLALAAGLVIVGRLGGRRSRSSQRSTS